MPRRKPAEPFGDLVRNLNLDHSIMAEGVSAGAEAIPPGFRLSSLLAGDVAGEPTHDPAIETVTDFTDAMLRAVKELNQNPELLKEVSKRIS